MASSYINRRDLRIKSLRALYGNSAEPFAWYIIIMEILEEIPKHRIKLNEKNYIMLCQELNIDIKELKQFIKIAKNLGILNVNSQYLFSNELQASKMKMRNYAITRREGGKAKKRRRIKMDIENNNINQDNINNDDKSKEKPKKEKKEKIELNQEIENQILEVWNSAKIIKHRKLTTNAKNKLRLAMRDYSIDEIMTAIINYGKIVNDSRYYFKYRWTLEDFLSRGIAKFVNEECYNNYLINKKNIPYREKDDNNDNIKF